MSPKMTLCSSSKSKSAHVPLGTLNVNVLGNNPDTIILSPPYASYLTNPSPLSLYTASPNGVSANMASKTVPQPLLLTPMEPLLVSDHKKRRSHSKRATQMMRLYSFAAWQLCMSEYAYKLEPDLRNYGC